LSVVKQNDDGGGNFAYEIKSMEERKDGRKKERNINEQVM
jgi:hypothetical protein